VKDFISALMNVNTEERLTAKQALEHDWIQQRAVPEVIDAKATSEAFNNLNMFRVSPARDLMILRLSKSCSRLL
jgi:serine/threonine protein kinase